MDCFTYKTTSEYWKPLYSNSFSFPKVIKSLICNAVTAVICSVLACFEVELSVSILTHLKVLLMRVVCPVLVSLT